MIDIEELINKGLVNILRNSNSLKKVIEAANLLAERGEYQELYRMAQGQHRRCLCQYNRHHIIIAMRALAETETEENKEFLSYLLRHETTVKSPKFGSKKLNSVLAAKEKYRRKHGEIKKIHHHHYPNMPEELRMYMCKKDIIYPDRENPTEDMVPPNKIEKRVDAILLRMHIKHN